MAKLARSCPLAGWDVSSVTDFSNLFSGKTQFNEPIGNWTVSSATNMKCMFQGATAFNQPLDSWGANLHSVTTMARMFNGATTFNQPLSSWGPVIGAIDPAVHGGHYSRVDSLGLQQCLLTRHSGGLMEIQ